MNTIILHGSPRKGKNSDTLVEHYLKGFNETESHQIKHFYLNEMNISPCQGCLFCATSKTHHCMIDDDMQEIYKAYKKADVIVWASPMYWGYLTAQLKKVQDRMEALAWEGFYDKTFIVFLTYRHHVDSTVNMFKRISPYFRIKLHILTCCTYDKLSGNDIPIIDLPDSLNEAFQLGIKIGTL